MSWQRHLHRGGAAGGKNNAGVLGVFAASTTYGDVTEFRHGSSSRQRTCRSCSSFSRTFQLAEEHNRRDGIIKSLVFYPKVEDDRRPVPIPCRPSHEVINPNLI
ncbi:hypothetical protein PIB30_027469 [Stylosanthes scabra]|uniref:Uncharacterized protein n=1 Tax=Stylosanthes scabra TaxID=79078 RepID=A0ABU6ZBZ2_9FABA|nr:hypothetical protein [Stylosanthes scabra]